MPRQRRLENSADSIHGSSGRKQIETGVEVTSRPTYGRNPTVYDGNTYFNAETIPSYPVRSRPDPSSYPLRPVWYKTLGMKVTPGTTYDNVKRHYDRLLQKHPEKRAILRQGWRDFKFDPQHGLHVPRNHAILSRKLQSTTSPGRLMRQYREYDNQFARGAVLPPPSIRPFETTRRYKKWDARWTRPQRGAMQSHAYEMVMEAYKIRRKASYDKALRHYYTSQGVPALRRQLLSYVSESFTLFKRVHRTSLSVYIRKLIYESIPSVTRATLEYITSEYANSVTGMATGMVSGIVGGVVRGACSSMAPAGLGPLFNVLFGAGKFAMNRMIVLQGRQVAKDFRPKIEDDVVALLQRLMHVRQTGESVLPRLSEAVVELADKLRSVPGCTSVVDANLFFIDRMVAKQIEYSLGIRIDGNAFRAVIEKHAVTIYQILAGYTVDGKILTMLKDVFRPIGGRYLVDDREIVILYQQLHPYLQTIE